jgi:hypothetical protein
MNHECGTKERETREEQETDRHNKQLGSENDRLALISQLLNTFYTQMF